MPSTAATNRLLPVPHARNPRLPHLPLQLEDTIHERLAGGRAPRHIDVNGDDAIAAAHDAVAVVVVAAAVGTRAHGDDPARLGHLIVDLAQRGRHLVGQRAGDNHDVRLPRRGTENDAHTILVVTRGGKVHHLDGAAGEAKGHGPEGGLAAPVDDLVEGCANLRLHALAEIVCLFRSLSRVHVPGGKKGLQRILEPFPVPGLLPGFLHQLDQRTVHIA